MPGQIVGAWEPIALRTFCLSRWYHYLSIVRITLSGQGQVTLQLTAFPIYVKEFSQDVLAGKTANIFSPDPNSLSVALCAGGKELAMEVKQQQVLLCGAYKAITSWVYEHRLTSDSDIFH